MGISITLHTLSLRDTLISGRILIPSNSPWRWWLQWTQKHWSNFNIRPESRNYNLINTYESVLTGKHMIRFITYCLIHKRQTSYRGAIVLPFGSGCKSCRGAVSNKREEHRRNWLKRWCFWLVIWEGPGSNLGWHTDYPDRSLKRFCSVSLGKRPDSISIRARPLPSTSFPIRYSLIILPFGYI
jgi:hypothetical protein